MKNIQAKIQTFAGAMMVPVILLVLVGFFVGIGSAFTNYILPEGTLLYRLFSMITNLGFSSGLQSPSHFHWRRKKRAGRHFPG